MRAHINTHTYIHTRAHAHAHTHTQTRTRTVTRARAQGAAWVESMLRSHEEGTFFAVGSYYTFHARKE